MTRLTRSLSSAMAATLLLEAHDHDRLVRRLCVHNKNSANKHTTIYVFNFTTDQLMGPLLLYYLGSEPNPFIIEQSVIVTNGWTDWKLLLSRS